MTIKITALLASVSAAVLYIFSLRYADDPYFFFISGSWIIGVIRLALCVGLINLAFQSRFSNAYSHIFYGVASVLLVAFGIAGFVAMPLDYSLIDYIKPLDFVFAMLIGCNYGIAALTYERGTQRLPRLSRPRSHQLRLLAKRA